MPKVVNIEDYRHETIDQLWERIRGIRKVIDAVVKHPRSTVYDCDRVLKLVPLREYLMHKAIITLPLAEQKKSLQ